MLQPGDVIDVHLEHWTGFATIVYVSECDIGIRWIIGPPDLYFRHDNCDAWIPTCWYPDNITKVSVDE